MIERKIDTIITDQYGNANYTYTGGGKGERDIVMKCGKVVSQPYTVLDCLFYDSGIYGSANNDWWNHTSYTNGSRTVKTDGTGTLLQSNSRGAFVVLANINGTSTSSISNLYDYPYPYQVEFDIVEIDTNGVMLSHFSSASGNSQANYNIKDIGATSGSHITSYNIGTKVIWQVDTGHTQGVDSVVQGYAFPVNCAIGLRVPQSSSVVYKNFKILPLQKTIEEIKEEFNIQ